MKECVNKFGGLKFKMSSMFFSKEEALRMGLFYCGRNDIDVSSLKKFNTIQIGFTSKKEADLYEIETSKGNKVQLGVEPFRNGFCLWLIDPISGFARRA